MKMGYRSELLIKAIAGAVMVAIVCAGGALISRRLRSKTDRSDAAERKSL